MMMEIAVVDNNVLTCLGLRGLLADVIPNATIRTFSSFGALMDDTPYTYAHYFVSSRIYLEHSQFFRQFPHKSIVLCGADGDSLPGGVASLNIQQDEKSLVRDLLALHHRGHHSSPYPGAPAQHGNLLSAREVEVCALLAKGFINKEIAQRLNISLTTVISHRKNIMDKIAANSLVDVAVYAILNGIVDIREI